MTLTIIVAHLLSHPGVLQASTATQWRLVIPVSDATATATPTQT